MKRKTKILGWLMGLMLGGLTVWTQAAEKPNIVFILADDMGWPDLSCYGNQFNETPVIDRLASEGIKFTDFYAATPVCSSTRSTIQTGQYSARTGITDFIPGHWRPFEKLVVPKIDHHLKEGVKTPGDVLGAAGYATGYFGKWHLGREAQHLPNKQGYQMTERELGKVFNKAHPRSEKGPKSIDFLTEAGIYFMEKNKEKPFFLTISHYAVHIPLEAREATIAKYEKKEKPAIGVNNPRYAGMTEDLDTSVGRILAKLKELGLEQNTVVVFASDNGGLRKIYTGVGEVVSSNAPLRDEKGTLYEGGMRVPLIVRWPGAVKPGSVSHEPTTTADLLSTFAEIAGASLPAQPIDGASLVGIFKDAQQSLNREAIYFHYPHYHHSIPGGAIRVGDWKLIEFFGDQGVELYNLKEDIGEQNNLAAEHPEKAAKLQGQLASWRKEVGARMPTINPKADAKRAGEWWNRKKNEPLDVEAMRKRYESKKVK
ncbi:MAG: sulfatase [Verrucomicrobiales bacterium]|nr:sulfatase [Verrucomicrobiales bacterium]